MPNTVKVVEIDHVREKWMKAKLIELLYHCGVEARFAEYEWIARELIANGVTFATDNNVGHKWISVKERLPELHTKVLCCGRKGGRFIAETSTWGEGCLYWTKRDGKGCPEVTHWMPLPEPPKGE